MIFLASVRHLNGAEPAPFTRTLDISTLGSDNFYIDVPEDWLALAAYLLPGLRSLNFARSPLLDSKAISCLQNQKLKHIRLFNASSCSNATSERLSTVIALFPRLYYLEIAGRRGLKSAGVLRRIRKLAHLRILCLQKCNLGDTDIAELSGYHDEPSLPNLAQIQSLDLSHNELTDASLAIISTSFRIAKQEHDDKLPSYNETLDITPQSSQGENSINHIFQRKLRYIKSGNWLGPPLQDGCEKVIEYLEDPNLPDPAEYMPGLTNLYISGNKISAEGLVNLLDLQQIRVLDVGSVELGEDYSLNCAKEETVIQISRLCKAIGLCPNLQHLRISHRVVTGSRMHSSENDNNVRSSI